MCRPSLFFTLWPKLVAMNSMPIEVMDSTKHFIGVESRLGINLIQKVVWLTALENIQVAVVEDVIQHLLTAVVVAFAIAVKAHVHRQAIKLLLGLFPKLGVRAGQQVVIVFGISHNLWHAALVSLKDPLLVFRVIGGGKSKYAPYGALLDQRAR